MKPFNLEEAKAGKKVVTRDGREVRIVCWDIKNEYPIIAAITENNGKESSKAYNETGKYFDNNTEADADLFMVTEQKEGWAILYKQNTRTWLGFFYTTRQDVEEEKEKQRLHDGTESFLAHITWEE